jgi:hypothetical protein
MRSSTTIGVLHQSERLAWLSGSESSMGPAMRIRSIAGFIILALSPSASFAQYDPQSYMDYLLRREQQKYELRYRERMYEEQRRAYYRSASDYQIQDELSRYCPPNAVLCNSVPPDLAEEGIRRGLLTASPGSASPGFQCLTFGDGMGGGITDCQ